MRIWFDIDEVLCATWQHILRKNNYKISWIDFKLEDWTEYMIEDTPKLSWILSPEDAEKYFKNIYIENDLNISPVDWVTWVVKKLKEDWHEVFVITAREVEWEEHTELWINKHFWDIFESIHYIKKENISKWELAERLNLELFIDDSMEHCISIAEKWIKTLLFDIPSNRKHINLSENIQRIHKMEEILNFVK